jgi:hypothetical protein
LNQTITIAPVRKTIVVQATPQRAFEVFTAGIDRWWPKTHGIGAAPVKESISGRLPAAGIHGDALRGGAGAACGADRL